MHNTTTLFLDIADPLPMLYNAVYEYLGEDQHWCYFVTLCLCNAVPPLLCGLLVWCVIEPFGLLQKYRIQPDKHTNQPLAKKALISQLFGTFVTTPLFTYFLFYFEVWSNPDIASREPPGTFRVIAEVVGSYLIWDFGFYWTHRLFHHPTLYGGFHKKHHEHRTPTGFSATHAHVLEVMFNHILPAYIAPVLLKAHLLTRWFYTLYVITDSFYAHSGYNLAGFVPFVSAERHDFHHSHNIGSYGLTPIWDWIGGTNKHVAAWQRGLAEFRTKNPSGPLYPPCAEQKCVFDEKRAAQ